jgi:hypothetical protein
VDDVSLSGSNHSLRYTSYQFLQAFQRSTWDANNNEVSRVYPPLTTVSGSPPSGWPFTTIYELNVISPTHIIFGATNSIYESFDQGNTISEVGVGIGNATTFEYGCRKNGVPLDYVLYAGDGSGTVYTRFIPTLTAIGATVIPFPGSTVRDLTIDPDDCEVVFAASGTNVYFSSNGGTSGAWTDVTGNLSTAENSLHSLLYVPAPASTGDLLLAGGRDGAYLMYVNSPGVWYELGTNLPTVSVWDMEYDATDDVLAIGTLGRGAWLVHNFLRPYLVYLPLAMR